PSADHDREGSAQLACGRRVATPKSNGETRMTNDDRREFFALMHRMAAGYEHDIGPERLDFYFDHLRDLSLTIVRRGIQQVVHECTRFPSVAHLRKAAFARQTPEIGQK